MVDLTALRTLIEGTPAYLTLINDGAHAELANTINAANSAANGGVGYNTVSRQEVIAAITQPTYLALTADNRESLRFLLQADQIDFNIDDIRTGVITALAGQTAALNAVAALAERQRKESDDLGGPVSKKHVAEVALLIPTSRRAQYRAGA